MSQEKKFKKDDFLCKEGEVLKSFFVIQSGKVSAFIERGGQRIEIDQLAPGQIVGEQGIFGFPKQTFNYQALSEVKTVELPLDPIKMVFDKSPAPYKIFVKALGEDLRRGRSTLRALKMEQDNAPCPPRFIPRLAAILTLVARNSGRKPTVDASIPAYKQAEEKAKNPTFKDDDLILNYTTLKIFTSRMFLESHQRMQNFCELLSKLGYLTLIMEKNEDTEQMEIKELRVHDTQTVELFGEFYQHNFFKAGKSEIIHLDTMAYPLAGALAALAADAEPDRNGAVKLNYQDLIKNLKERFFIDLKGTHFTVLEKKGLFVKRTTENETVYLSFDRQEFAQTYKFWQIINEIDHWNEKGFVDLNADYNEYKSGDVKDKCPSCATDIKQAANFCPNCGHKLQGAEAA